MATMNGIDNHGFADNAKRLRRELAELKEMVKLGAGLPGDEQKDRDGQMPTHSVARALPKESRKS